MTMQMTEVRSRPMGVTILGILQLLAGMFGLCLPVILVAGGLGVGLIGGVGTVVGGVALFFALLMLIGPLLHLIVAYGAFNLRPWAWWLGIVATGVDVIGAALNLWNGTGVLQAIGPAAFSLLILIYLLTPGVRQAFKV